MPIIHDLPRMLPAAAALTPFMGGGLAAAPFLLDLLEDDAFCAPMLDPCRLQQLISAYYFNQGWAWGWNDSQNAQMQQQLLYSLLLGGGRRRRGLRRRRGGLDAMDLMMMGGGGGGFGMGAGLRVGGLAAGGGVGALMAPQLGSHHMLINQPRLWYPM